MPWRHAGIDREYFVGFASMGRWLVGVVLLAVWVLSLAQPSPAGVAAPPVPAGVGILAGVGPGDTLAITVYGQPELGARVTVDIDGRVTVPFVGELTVQGLSATAIGRQIAEGLKNKGYLIDPQVAVEIVSVRSQMVSVLGEVAQPGRYPLEGRLTVLEALSMAGGLKADAADTAVLLRRGQDETADPLHIRLASGSERTPTPQAWSTLLQAGDVVYVGEMPRFYIYGEVARPGSYPMEPELNIMRALSLAGGLTQRASERRVEIRRTDPQSNALRTTRASQTDTVQAGDVIYVKERFF